MPVRAQHVTALTRDDEAADLLAELADADLLQLDGAGYRIAKAASGFAPPPLDELVGYFVEYLTANRSAIDRIGADLVALSELIERLAAQGELASALRLGAALEPVLALSKRLDAWRATMGTIEKAALASNR